MNLARRDNVTRVLTAMACSLALATSACSRYSQGATAGTFPTDSGSAPAMALLIVDTSGSVLEQTDLINGAQNRLQALIKTMPVEGKVVVHAFNSNVTANCDDLTVGLPKQANPDLEAQVRKSNLAKAKPAFQKFLRCSQDANLGGTELFGGLAEAFTFYPDAQVVDLYTDGCENVSAKNVCNSTRLKDQGYVERVVERLDQRLVPTLGPITITFHGIGRGTGLDAGSVATLRSLIATWTERTGATARFANS